MRPRSAIALAIAACALHLAGAVSPLSSASDYYFTHPALTNNIRGVVMGDSASYAIPRSEDLAFLAEAIAERNALFLGTGSYDSWTNHLAEVESGLGRLDSLDIKPLSIPLPFLAQVLNPSNELSSTIRIIEPITNLVAYTNYSISAMQFETNLVAYSQTLTNHVVDVYTNAIYYFSFTNYTVSVATNIAAEEDFCFVDYLHPYPDLPDHITNLHPSMLHSYVYDLGGTAAGHDDKRYSKGQLTNLYAIIRASTRSRPRLIVNLDVPDFQSVTLEKSYQESDPSDYRDGETISTNHNGFVYTIWNYRSYIKDGRYQADPVWDESSLFTSIFTCPDVSRLVFSSGVLKLADEIGSCKRIKSAQVFAVASASWGKSQGTTWSFDSTNSSQTSTSFSTNIYQTVVIPLGEALPINVASNDTACLGLECSDFASKATRAFALCGIPDLFYRSYTADYLPGSPQWNRNDRWYLNQSSTESVSLHAYRFFAILEFAPRTVLELWEASP